MNDEPDIAAPADWIRKHWWAIPAAAVLFLAALVMVFGKDQKPGELRSSYDPAGNGFRAAYLLLEKLGYPVARSKRLAGGAARMVLSPYAKLNDAANIDGWVRAGGVLILADENGDFAGKMGITLKIKTMEESSGDRPASGAGISRLRLGAKRVEWPGQSGAPWVTAEGQAVVTAFPRGDGEIWLIHYPEIFTNRAIRQADNAPLLCRLVEEVLRDRPGKLLFDDYFHGMTDRPGVTELLLQPPAIWVSLQGLVLVGLALWHYAPRFGTLRPATPRSRRSKEEFLDAMAALLDRKRDFGDAFRTVRDGFLREIEQELGRPAGTPVEEVVADAAQRRSLDRERLLRLLTAEGPPDGKTPAAFLHVLNELETFRNELFRQQRHGKPSSSGPAGDRQGDRRPE